MRSIIARMNGEMRPNEIFARRRRQRGTKVFPASSLEEDPVASSSPSSIQEASQVLPSHLCLTERNKPKRQEHPNKTSFSYYVW